MYRQQLPAALAAVLLFPGLAQATFVPDFRIHPDDYTVLMVVDAARPPELRAFQPGGHGKFYVTGWQRADQVASWQVTVPEADEYAVNVLLHRRKGGALKLEVAAGDSRVSGVLPETAGRWQRRPLEGTLRLPKGPARVELRLQAARGGEFDAEVMSVELVRPAVRDRLHAAALKMRADTRALQQARYGFMFHWTSTTCPRQGEPKAYDAAVRDFNVEAFADQVKEGGAGFVVLTTSHAFQYFPAPIQALDRILPGRTSRRDLVGELADALGKRGIKLWLYYHLGASSDPEWMKASHFFDTDTSRLWDNWCSIVSEVGTRYGKKLAGWWFDDGATNYYYRSAPWERLETAARAGNPERLIGFNPWELPPPTEFEDYFCGEGFGDPSVGGALPAGGDGRFPAGPYQGLQACATLITEGDWGHWRKDAEIGKPRWSAPELTRILSEFIAHKNVPIFDLEVYQDGTCSPETIRLFKQAAAALPPPAGAAGETPAERAQRMAWWRDARLGMFIHWGPVSLKGTEISWSRANSNPKCPNRGPIPVEVYDNLYKQFDPVKFDAREWVAIAKAAGMRYMVLTAKHCDGFLLWDSKTDPYNIMHTPFKRDVCGELAKAAHEAGMKIGWYFSPMDWRDPDFRTERNADFLKRMQGEIRELLTNYGPIDILWFDHDGREAVYDQADTYALVKKLQPNIVINNRLDLGVGQSNRLILSPYADYYTPEQAIGSYDDEQPWESCMTISRRGQWAWGGADDGVKSFEQCMNMLIRCAGGDGNMLLNVGPMPTGEIAPEQVGRLKEMGAWLTKYGESIYGTRGGPFKPGRFGVSTRKGRTIYVHVQRWPEGVLTLPPLPAKILRCTALTGGKPEFKQSDEAIEISLPAADRQAIDTIIALELDRPAGDLPAVAPPAMAQSLTTGKKATASNVYHGSAEFAAGKACDGDGETRWATDSGTKSAWLEVDLGAPTTFGRAVVEQAFPELQRCRKFAIEYWQEGEWKACYKGENLGPTLDVSFAPVTAQRVRLNITEATDGPTIWEFGLYPPKK